MTRKHPSRVAFSLRKSHLARDLQGHVYLRTALASHELQSAGCQAAGSAIGPALRTAWFRIASTLLTGLGRSLNRCYHGANARQALLLSRSGLFTFQNAQRIEQQ
jgi:hypothetical protein